MILNKLKKFKLHHKFTFEFDTCKSYNNYAYKLEIMNQTKKAAKLRQLVEKFREIGMNENILGLLLLLEKKGEVIGTVLQNDIAKSLLSEDEITQVAEKPSSYSIIILRLLIVFTFYRLFIAEKADLRYTNSTFDLRLKDLISG